MALLDDANLRSGGAEIYTNSTAGSAAYAWVGYTQGPATVSHEETARDIPVEQSDHPLKTVTDDLGLRLRATLLEPTIANIGKFTQGTTVTASVLTLGESTDDELAVDMLTKVTGTTYRIQRIPYARADGNVELAYQQRGAETLLPIVLRGMYREGSTTYTMWEPDLAVVLSTDAATRVADQVHHIIQAETGVADDLATITGASLTNLEYIVIRPDLGDTITVKHDGGGAAGTITLADTTDFAMNNKDDRLVLQHLAAGNGTWNEIERITA